MKKIIYSFLFIFCVTPLYATIFFVDPTNGNDAKSGLSWSAAVKTIGQAQTLATANPGVDDVYVKGGGSDIITTTVWALTTVTENFYGSFEGWESSPDQRPMNDNDGNGIIEPWEFKYPTIYKVTYSNTAINGSAYILDGFTITHIGTRSSAMATISSPIGGTIQNCIFTGCYLTFTNIVVDLGGCLVKTIGTFKNNLIEKNTVAVDETADCRLVPILEVNCPGTGTVPTVLITGCVFRNNTVSVTWSSAAAAPTKLNFIINVSASALATPVTISNCLIHNNEASYTGSVSFPNSPNSGLVGSTNGSGSYTSDSYINCLFANNKLTNLGTCMSVKSNTNVTHKIYNTVFWNNQNNGIAVSMASSAKQSAASVVSNNYMDVATTGTWTGTTGFVYTENHTDLNNASNTGINAPYFVNPTSVIGYTADGTVEKAVWCISNGSYLSGKGVATMVTTDKADVAFATIPTVGAYEFVYFKSNATGNWNSGSTWQTSFDNANWGATLSNPSRTYAAGVSITNGNQVSIVYNATASALTVDAGGQLTLNSGKTLKVSSMSLSSTASGTGTFVDNTASGGLTVNGTTTVQQYLNADHSRNWYISSPVSSATVPATGYTFYQRNESGNGWPVLNSGDPLVAGQGYIAAPVSAPGTFSFTGGGLNSGNVPVTLSYTNGVSKAGFNLLGNPYPSHITLTKAVTDAANALNTIWYRTVDSYNDATSKYVYSFKTCLINADGSYIGTPDGTTPVLAPMQAFWVRTNTNNSTLTFTNGMRSHQNANLLKAPAKHNSSRPLLRLQVTNGANADETVLYANENASDNFDSYDAPKMLNGSAGFPEIYTESDSEMLAINGLNNIPLNTEIPVGFITGEANNFQIKATEVNNLDPGVRIILKDKLLNTETDITETGSYAFASNALSTSSRFSILFRAVDISTGLSDMNETENVCSVFGDKNQQIGISCEPAFMHNANVKIYTATGRQITDCPLISSLTYFSVPTAGVYIVEISGQTKTEHHKIIIR